MEDLYKILEILNEEKSKIKESKEYKIGNTIVTFAQNICQFNFKLIFKNLRNKRVARIVKKKYYNPLTLAIIQNDKIDYRKCKIVIYTCVLGNYDNIQKHLLKFDNVDYYILTDDRRKYEIYKDYYKIIELPRKILNKGNIIANRYVKFHPMEFFEDYDYAIYIDGNVRIISDIRKFIQNISDNTGIAMHLHRERRCIYDEAEVCKLLKRGNTKKIDEQMKKYKKEGFPINFGMNEASVIVCDLKNKIAIKLLDEWYLEFIKSGSLRDQLAWTYVLWKNNYKISDVGNLGNNIYRNYKLEMYKHGKD